MLKLARPRGLAARAILFTTLLVFVTASVSATILIIGAQREGERQELAIARDLTLFLAQRSGELMARGNARVLQRMIQGSSSLTNVRSLTIRDASNNVLAQEGGAAADQAALAAVTERALREQRLVHDHFNGALVVAAPILRDGQVVGVVGRSWEPGAYHFDALPTLAPFLVILFALTGASVLMTARVVRRAIAPLDVLAQHVERVAESGVSPPIRLNTGDEFETLASAFNNMTMRLEASMRQIQEIAFVDPVTRLPNQDRFSREIDFFILQNEDARGAVAVFELQRVGKLLQTLDPDASREFMRLVADRFLNAVRAVDRLVRRGQGATPPVGARLSSTELAVLAAFYSPADAMRFAQHLNVALNQPFDWRGHKLTLGACCGVALTLRDGRDADTLIRHARMALMAAPDSPSRVRTFTSALDREAVARMTLEREMRGALERNEFRAYFQPKINLATGRIEACEALARWVRPDRTIVGPGRFIPVAEESGLIVPLSDAILRESCWKAAAWSRAGLPINVAVNVSALQFRNDRFSEHVLRVLEHAGLAPTRLELEITESMVVEDPERAQRIIKPLREAGVRLAIDDFGCGHSSLAALSKLPFDVIKIDQQFVRALERGDAQSAAIVEMILALARTLNMEVVAEGVERREDVEFMAERGCHWVQGFLYGAAVSASDFAEMLRRQAGEDVTAFDAA